MTPWRLTGASGPVVISGTAVLLSMQVDWISVPQKLAYGVPFDPDSNVVPIMHVRKPITRVSFLLAECEGSVYDYDVTETPEEIEEQMQARGQSWEDQKLCAEELAQVRRVLLQGAPLDDATTTWAEASTQILAANLVARLRRLQERA